MSTPTDATATPTGPATLRRPEAVARPDTRPPAEPCIVARGFDGFSGEFQAL